MENYNVDILAIGAHPDDVELGCGGTLIKHLKMGYQVAILDLTQGELGSRGTVQTRQAEAAAASAILGVQFRENLSLEDGFFIHSKENILKIIQMLRKYKPTIVFGTAIQDRHPDHARASKLVGDAVFLSGLKKLETILDGKSQEPWRPKAYYNYIQALDIKADFVVDISDFMEQKMEAVLAYKTQFYNPQENIENTFISSPEFLEFVKARASHLGVPIGKKYAEGFTQNRQIGVDDILKLI